MRRSFPRTMASLEAIVAYVREFLAAEGLDEGSAYDLDLVLEELFTNLVKYGKGARGDVEIRLERGPDGVTAVLREFDAEPFDPTKLPEVDVSRPIAERRPGGLGVHFIRQLTRSFDYDYRDRIGEIRVAMRNPA
jgi:anti-sigma regulatory factor (Ser/Thr protein kinase)